MEKSANTMSRTTWADSEVLCTLQEILDNAGCGIYVADNRSRSILYTNGQFEKMFAHSTKNREDVIFSEKELSRGNYSEEIYDGHLNQWFDVHKSEIDWTDGRKVSLCTIYDITDKKAYQKKAEELLHEVDKELLRERGQKDGDRGHGAEGEAAFARRREIERNMRSAAMHSCDEFEVYYQPIINSSADGMPCCGAEALVRWNSRELGFMSPDTFIPLAEYLGLIKPIGEYVLHNAAARCKRWNDMGYPNYKVNVNLSVVQLLEDNIVEKIARVIEDTQINPANLTLEVTESLAINDMNRMKRVLADIKALGVKLALDDFGTGYSSLNHIREMPLDVIKIDRCFIENLGEDEFSDAFVSMVSELAHKLGVRVCVEGVETSRQCDSVRKMDIQMIQGFYFGKPMKIEEFEKRYVV